MLVAPHVLGLARADQRPGAAVASNLDDGLGNPLLIWLLALPVAWQFLYAQRRSAFMFKRDAAGDSHRCG